MVKDANFLPYNKELPDKIGDSSNITNLDIDDLSNAFIETDIYIMVVNQDGSTLSANYSI